MFALIQNGRVAQIEENTFPVGGMEWIECDSSVKENWHYVDGVFKETLLSDDELLVRAKDKKKAEIKALRISNLKKPTPQTIEYAGALSNKTFNIDVDKSLPLISSILGTLKDKRQEWLDDTTFAQENRARFGVENPTRYFTDASGDRLELGIADFRSLKFHLDQRDEAEFGQYQARVNAVDALTTIAAVEAYDINTAYE